MWRTSVPADALAFLREQIGEHGPFQIEFRDRREDDWPVTLDYWFGSPRWRVSGHTFELVGVDSTGGMFCLWRYPDLGVREAPVVFLGSEGEGVSVVAGDVGELVEVLAQGYWWFGSIARFTCDEEHLQQPAFDTFAAAARAFLARPLRAPDAIVEAAVAAHPNFAAFVTKVLELGPPPPAGDDYE